MKTDWSINAMEVRQDRRQALDSYIAGRIDMRSGRDRRSPERIEEDNAFVNRKAAEWFAAFNRAA